MVEHPGQYPWSSYAHNACGETNPALHGRYTDTCLFQSDTETQQPESKTTTRRNPPDTSAA